VMRDDVYLVAGWSDKVFDVLKAVDEGNNAVRLIDEIAL